MERGLFLKTLSVAVIASLLCFSAPSLPAFAADDAQVISNKLNISGRQRMLTQRIAKASCFAYLDIEKDMHLGMAKKALA